MLEDTTVKHTILQLAEACAPRLQAIWEELHRNPELGFQEFRTAETIAGILKGLDIETGGYGRPGR